MSKMDWKTANLSEISDAEGEEICNQLRCALVESVSKTGGHLASNLGAVELTVALHRVFDTAKDRLVFDVGHQCYVHKMLTGRGERMDTLRRFGGLSGFPSPAESEHDAFIAGHASNSVSVALGMARARKLTGQDYRVVAVIGDGALTGGLAHEGLSDAGASGENMLVILNDNGMSIKKNVGGMATLLAKHHLRRTYLNFKKCYRRVTSSIPGGKAVYRFFHKIKKNIKGVLLPSSYFEEMGFQYIGPVDGHNLSELTRLVRWADGLEGPVLLHIRTVKGKGYPPAEQRPDLFHGIGPFDPKTGLPLAAEGESFSDVFGETLTRLAEKDGRICAVTAAMQSGTGLDGFARQFPERIFDVGIAEGHAAAMCAGAAKQGALPVFAVYSTFLQRSYDMLLHDVAIQRLHVVLGIDRAGLVGADGVTHQGIFDIAYLSTIPGITVLSPASFAELRRMLEWALYDCQGPVAVRYPRGGENGYTADSGGENTACLRAGTDVTLVTYGILTGNVLAAAERLRQEGISAEVLKLNQIVPLDDGPVFESVARTGRLVTVEEVTAKNCVGRILASTMAERGIAPRAIRLLNTGEGFVVHGAVSRLRQELGLSVEGIMAAVRELIQ